ncbi:MAG TPA: protease SohB [Gammaproteobacteria bacterium]|nr:protease SohB [Gammaproteobacteria bacterium]
MEFIYEYGLFLAKSATVVVAIIVVLVAMTGIMMRGKQRTAEGHIELKHLNERLQEMRESLQHALLDKHELKRLAKAEKVKAKAEAKAGKKSRQESGESGRKPAVFVLNFAGDIRAQAVHQLREEITAVLAVAGPHDQVVARLESSGGMVHAYGLGASQLQRVKDKGIRLTACVDKVAASGGYMMACVADRILSAPFAVIGSIGVLAQLPNFHRLLKKHDIDYEMLTAGEYKRTLTVFGENTDKDRAKVKQDLEDIHDLFKTFVRENRPAVDINEVATGEVWYGRQALERRLIDELKTSDAFLIDLCETAEVYEVRYVEKKPLQERLGLNIETALERLLQRWLGRNTHY